MSPVAQKNPEYPSVRLDDHRFELPTSLSVPWLSRDRKVAFVPLRWKRAVRLPASMSLEAWYLADLESSEEWNLDPHGVTAGSADLSADELAEARGLIYPAPISRHRDRWRIKVPKLLTTFAAQSEGLTRAKIIISLEGESLAVWTFRAFQAHFGSITG